MRAQVTSETIEPADNEMHVLLNGSYVEALHMMACNREALDALIDALLLQPSSSTSNGARSNGKIARENGNGSGEGQGGDDDEGLIDEGGTLTGDEVRRIVRDLGDEEYLAWSDAEHADFL